MANSTSLPEAFERHFARMRELAAHDAEIGALIPKPELQQATLAPGLATAQIVDLLLSGYAARPALGERRYEIVADTAGKAGRRYQPSFATVSYAELHARIRALASAWQHDSLHGVARDSCVCIIGSTGIDFAVLDMATSYMQAVSVPLQTTLGATHLKTIFNDTEPACIAATIADLALIAPLAIDYGKVRSLIVFDYDARIDAEREAFHSTQAAIHNAGADIHLITLADLIAIGRQVEWQPLPPHPRGLDRLAALIHSSGSTGTPKGVMMPERAMNLGWLGIGAPQVPTVTVAFGPMNHFLGRHQVFNTLAAGGTAYYTALPDLSLLFDDIRLVRPTFLLFFPRVLELVYQHYQGEVVRRVGEGVNAAQADKDVRAEMRANFLGDRLRGGTYGSAPLAQEVAQFMRDCFDILMVEGYGSTESGIMTCVAERVMRPHVIDYKLRDVPELGYFRSDKPFPRGELLVKSRGQALGFYKRPEATAAVFDADGYVATGDIMEERGPDQLVYVDRRNDVLKLSQAEFVAVGSLGATFEAGSAVIKQIYIYGNSARAYLLAVVVPDMDVAAELLGPNPDEANLKALIRAEMQKVARESRLRTFEVPRDFIIELEPFSVENGLLTSVRKRMRPKLKEKYGDRLEALYVDIEKKRQDELLALKSPDSPLSVLEKVVKALEATLGIDGIDPETTQTFADLGGDSLGSVGFAMFVKDIFGVELPVNAIVSPAGNPRRWARMIETMLKQKSGATNMPTSTSIHGANARVLNAKDITLDRFVDARILDKMPSPPSSATRVVLLTGASGFLGRFLCLQWMEHIAPFGGKVIALIRANSDLAARQRLDQVFCGIDPDLESLYRALAAQHLEVLAGDFAEPSLGLTAAHWDRLAHDVDHIVHPGALVNHVLSYEHLFEPNVFGTAELIRLALTQRQKRFDFVSSMASAYRVDRLDEDAPLRQEIPLTDDYADGYGASKWADEVLLHDAHRRCRLQVNIFRGDMIMPHRRYHGQINVPDMFTRLLYSIVMTELAPASFYQLGPDGKRARAHYDGMPVDFLAAAMVAIGAETQSGIRTFNTINHHYDDGISLDSVVDWVQSAGYSVDRIHDHHEWLQRFDTKLHALTEAQRQHSSVSLLHQFKQPFPSAEPHFDSRHFVDAIRRLNVAADVPHLNEAYIHKYLDDMHRLGLLPLPRNKDN